MRVKMITHPQFSSSVPFNVNTISAERPHTKAFTIALRMTLKPVAFGLVLDSLSPSNPTTKPYIIFQAQPMSGTWQGLVDETYSASPHWIAWVLS